MILGIDFHNRYVRLCTYAGSDTEEPGVMFEARVYRDNQTGNYSLLKDNLEDYTLINNILEEKEDLKAFLELVITDVCKTQKPSKVCLCVMNFELTLLENIRECLLKLGFKDEDFVFIDRQQALASYIINKNLDIRFYSSYVIDYSTEGLYIYSLDYDKDGDAYRITEFDHTADVPFLSDDSEATVSKLDVLLYDTVLKCFEGHNVLGVFLFGEGFSGNRRYEEFMKFVCKKRRVFAGDDLYAMGACVYAANLEKGIHNIVDCEDNIMYDLDLDIVEWGQSSLYRVVRRGTNWYEARNKFSFFVGENTDSVVLHRIDKKKKGIEDIEIKLTSLPKRPHLASRVSMGFDFGKEGKCTVLLQDKGFGEFEKASSMFVKVEI